MESERDENFPPTTTDTPRASSVLSFFPGLKSMLSPNVKMNQATPVSSAAQHRLVVEPQSSTPNRSILKDFNSIISTFKTDGGPINIVDVNGVASGIAVEKQSGTLVDDLASANTVNRDKRNRTSAISELSDNSFQSAIGGDPVGQLPDIIQSGANYKLGHESDTDTSAAYESAGENDISVSPVSFDGSLRDIPSLSYTASYDTAPADATIELNSSAESGRTVTASSFACVDTGTPAADLSIPFAPKRHPALAQLQKQSNLNISDLAHHLEELSLRTPAKARAPALDSTFDLSDSNCAESIWLDSDVEVVQHCEGRPSDLEIVFQGRGDPQFRESPQLVDDHQGLPASSTQDEEDGSDTVEVTDAIPEQAAREDLDAEPLEEIPPSTDDLNKSDGVFDVSADVVVSPVRDCPSRTKQGDAPLPAGEEAAVPVLTSDNPSCAVVQLNESYTANVRKERGEEPVHSVLLSPRGGEYIENKPPTSVALIETSPRPADNPTIAVADQIRDRSFTGENLTLTVRANEKSISPIEEAVAAFAVSQSSLPPVSLDKSEALCAFTDPSNTRFSAGESLAYQVQSLSLSVDSGSAAFVKASTPSVEALCSAVDTPVSGIETFCSSQTPVLVAESLPPAEPSETPLTEAPTSAPGAETPVTESKTSDVLAESSAPEPGTTITEDEPSAPVSWVNLPKAKSSAAVAETAVSEAKSSAAVAETAVSEAVSFAAVTETAVPEAVSFAAVTETAVPEAVSFAAVAETAVPEAVSFAAVAETSVPEAVSSAAVTKTTDPEAESSAAVAETADPEAESSAAVAETVVPEAESSSTVADTAVPQAESSAAVAESPVHEAESAAAVAETPVPEAESCAPVAETGVLEAESSASVAETAVPEGETSAPVAKTAVPEAESTALVPETGVLEAESPPVAATTVFESESSPLTGTAILEAESSAPVTETGVPEPKFAPVAETALPEAEPSTPVAETAVPEAEPSTPVAKTAVPEGEPSTPVAKTAVPEGEPSAPVAETGVLEAESSTPVAETAVPEAETAVPEAETAVPEAETAVPEAETAVPEAETSPPVAATTVFESESSPLAGTAILEAESSPLAGTAILEAESSAPVTETGVPEPKFAPVAETALPEAEPSTPVAETAVPEAEPSPPVAETAVAEAETSAPVPETPVPVPESSSSEAEIVVPEAKDFVPVAHTTAPEAKSFAPIDETSLLEAKTSAPTTGSATSVAVTFAAAVETPVPEGVSSASVVARRVDVSPVTEPPQPGCPLRVTSFSVDTAQSESASRRGQSIGEVRSDGDPEPPALANEILSPIPRSEDAERFQSAETAVNEIGSENKPSFPKTPREIVRARSSLGDGGSLGTPPGFSESECSSSTPLDADVKEDNSAISDCSGAVGRVKPLVSVNSNNSIGEPLDTTSVVSPDGPLDLTKHSVGLLDVSCAQNFQAYIPGALDAPAKSKDLNQTFELACNSPEQANSTFVKPADQTYLFSPPNDDRVDLPSHKDVTFNLGEAPQYATFCIPDDGQDVTFNLSDDPKNSTFVLTDNCQEVPALSGQKRVAATPKPSVVERTPFSPVDSLRTLIAVSEQQERTLREEDDFLRGQKEASPDFEALSAEAAKVSEEISLSFREIDQKEASLSSTVIMADNFDGINPFASRSKVAASPPLGRRQMCNGSQANVTMARDAKTALLDLNLSEAGPDTAGEHFQSGELFRDSAAFDFLSSVGSSTSRRELSKESLYVKFDPLVGYTSNTTSDIPLPNMQPNLSETISSKEEQSAAAESAAVPESKPEAELEPEAQAKSAQTVPQEAVPQSDPTPPPRTPQRNKAVAAATEKLISLSPAGGSPSTPPGASALKKLDSSTVGSPQSSRTIIEVQGTPTSRGQVVTQDDLIRRLQEHQIVLEEQDRAYQSRIAELERENEQLMKKAQEKAQGLSQLSLIMKEYEKTISRLVAEKEHEKKAHEEKEEGLIKERDSVQVHLNNIEIAFSDLHKKYERSKAMIEGFKKNEEALNKALAESEENLKKMQNMYEMLKSHAVQKLETANQELVSIHQRHQQESAKLKAMVKKLEIKTKSLEESLEQKTKENQALTSICDELIKTDE